MHSIRVGRYPEEPPVLNLGENQAQLGEVIESIEVLRFLVERLSQFPVGSIVISLGELGLSEMNKASRGFGIRPDIFRCEFRSDRRIASIQSALALVEQ